MAPKAKPKVDERKVKIAEDKTFGMKNKNKSKTVQKYIKQITMNATGDSARQANLDRKEKADKEVAAKKQALAAGLFNLQTDKKGKAYDPTAKKAAKLIEEEAIMAGKKVKEEEKKAIIEGVANTIRLTNPKAGIRMSEMGGHPIIQALKTKYADTFRSIQLLLFIKANDRVFWVDDPESANPTIRCQEDVDLETAPDERTLEEIIEERRRELVGPGTPVTEESFKAWKAKQDQMKKDKMDAKFGDIKKSGGKGLSGRDLFTYDASLFVDDDGAASADELNEREDRLESEDEDDEGEGEDEGDDDDDEPDAEAKDEAASSKEATGAVAINQNLFLEEDGGDLDDLDDLDDD